MSVVVGENVMKNFKKIPRFSYDISRKDKRPACILAGHSEYVKIKDVDGFLSVLGYSGEARKAGVLPDEYIWDKYCRDGADKTGQCLQSKIIEYVFNHSDRFRKEYGREYVNLLGKCTLGQMDDSDICKHCPMHPSHLYETLPSISYTGNWKKHGFTERPDAFLA